MTFQGGNQQAAIGGRARAQALTPERRREIAREGGRARARQLAETHFDGDLEAARAYVRNWLAYINDPYRHTPLERFPYPGGPLPRKENTWQL